MMDYLTLELVRQDHTAIITLNRPEKLNAITRRMFDELHDLFSNVLLRDEEVRVVIVTGKGRAFSAGADLHEVPSGGPHAVEESFAFSRKCQTLFTAIEQFPKPVIAAINGLAFGGGCEITLVCDLRIASEEAALALPEVNLGGLPGAGGTQRLPRLIGATKAKEMLYLGEPISAQEALFWGLVNRVVPKDRLLDESLALAGKLSKKLPQTLAQIKTLANQWMNVALPAGLELEARALAVLSAWPERQEPVRWRGREDQSEPQ